MPSLIAFSKSFRGSAIGALPIGRSLTGVSFGGTELRIFAKKRFIKIESLTTYEFYIWMIPDNDNLFYSNLLVFLLNIHINKFVSPLL